MIRTFAAAATAFVLLACAPAPPTAQERAPTGGSTFARLGENVLPSGVPVQPMRVVEDSRCPLSVQCVHAGTVRLAVRLGQGAAARESILRLRQPEPIGGGRVLRLVGVCPFPGAPGAPLQASSYRFQLAVGRDGEPVPPPPMCAPA